MNPQNLPPQPQQDRQIHDSLVAFEEYSEHHARKERSWKSPFVFAGLGALTVFGIILLASALILRPDADTYFTKMISEMMRVDSYSYTSNISSRNNIVTETGVVDSSDPFNQKDEYKLVISTEQGGVSYDLTYKTISVDQLQLFTNLTELNIFAAAGALNVGPNTSKPVVDKWVVLGRDESLGTDSTIINSYLADLQNKQHTVYGVLPIANFGKDLSEFMLAEIVNQSVYSPPSCSYQADDEVHCTTTYSSVRLRDFMKAVEQKTGQQISEQNITVDTRLSFVIDTNTGLLKIFSADLLSGGRITTSYDGYNEPVDISPPVGALTHEEYSPSIEEFENSIL